MVVLLDACPEYSCLVYEYMANGSLGVRLPFPTRRCHGRAGHPMAAWFTVPHLRRHVVLAVLAYSSWWADTFRQLESGLSGHPVIDLLHDKRTHCFPGAIVGTRFHDILAVDPAWARDNRTLVDFHDFLAGVYKDDTVTPESQQQTSMLLQIITAKPPMGLTHHVGRALERSTLCDLLDPAVTDWPVEEAQCLAKMALRCYKLRRKDRSDLVNVVLLEFNRLCALGEDNMQFCGGMHNSADHSSTNFTSTVANGVNFAGSGERSVWVQMGAQMDSNHFKSNGLVRFGWEV